MGLPVQERRHGQIHDHRQCDHRDADAERVELGRVGQAADRLDDDHSGAEHDQHALERCGQVVARQRLRTPVGPQLVGDLALELVDHRVE